MNTYVQGSHPAALCQPPPPGVVDERLDALLDEILMTPLPPMALVSRMVAAKGHLQQVGQRADALRELATSPSLIVSTHAMAAAAPGHDPYRLDDALTDEAQMLDDCAALGVLLRMDRSAGQALDLATTGMAINAGGPWHEWHRRHAEDAASALLLAARRMRG